jgi:hypothetical protein
VKKKIRYETPILLDMRGPYAKGAVTACGGGISVDDCAAGSCVAMSICGEGWDAQFCVPGSAAATKTSGCVSCCQTGTYVGSTYPGIKATNCWCNMGNTAGYTCYNGTLATQDCSTGSDYGYCY